MDASLTRHRAACDNAAIPGGRLPFRILGIQVGWVWPDRAADLRGIGGLEVTETEVRIETAPTETLLAASHHCARLRLAPRRGEDFDVRAAPDQPVLARIDRGLLPLFGVEAQGVHLNGLVRDGEALFLWVARRSATRSLDPGKLDHLVAGGVPAGLTPHQTLLKEAAEEASIPAALMADAVPVGQVRYAMDRPEGLRRDLLHCYDIYLPPDFRPVAADGEVEAFEPWPMSRVLSTVRDTDAFKFNVNLVLIELFRRLGLI
jgi:8-oxo-dGTP pyrophosphatase MutT (NUDIX family)